VDIGQDFVERYLRGAFCGGGGLEKGTEAITSRGRGEDFY